MAKSYYDILGVGRDASEKEVRSAYRRLARKYHPDVTRGDKSAEARFKELNEAYQVLSDAGNRKKYDRFGENWRHADQFARSGAGGGPSPFTWFNRARQPRSAGQAAGAGGFGSFGDIFGDLFGTRTRTNFDDAVGLQQVEVPVTVTLEEAYAGTTRMVQTPPDPFSGQPGHRLEVKIPTGVRSGSRVHIGAPVRGGAPIDIYLAITVAPNATFERKGDDLLTSVDVPLVDAVLGGEVEVPTITGKRIALKLPPETQNGRAFRLTGKGMPRRTGGSGTAHGDLLATVKVVLPDALTDRQRELFEQLRKADG